MSSLIVTSDGFEDSELTYPYYRLQEADVDVDLATPGGETVTGKIGEEMDADLAIEDARPDEYELLVIPGGRAPESMRLESPDAVEIIRRFDEQDKPIAAICHGVQLLISADMLDGREATGYWTLEVDVENAGATFTDDAVVVDDNLITSRAPQDLPMWMDETLSQLPEAVAAD